MSRFSLLSVCALLLAVYASVTFAQTGAKRRPTLSQDTVATATASTTSMERQNSWSFLSLGACGVDEFIKQHPTYDGRGTIVAVLDDGVDPGIEGLLKTSEGKRKIIDVQDFSGTGDLTYQPAERKGDQLFLGGTHVLSGLDKLAIHPVDGKYYYAVLEESHFKNGLGDLNFNGGKSDSFGVIVFEDAPDHYAAVVDGDADGDVSNESIISTYKEKGDLFRLRAAATSTHHDERFLSGAVNIFPSEHRINLYFADGGHGTHVAGIAGGCNIDGQVGFNGVAPGAEMVALKFADNTIGGLTVTNSMKRAYEYVVKLAQESGKPVIANMSFGVGSELEGQSVMDQWLDSLLEAHPEVTVCIAAGNEGPGLSNIGLPGTARSVITSGAGLPNETGRDLYGVAMSKTIVWDFSSRGGELAKPDIVSPGTAISTVPDYVGGDRYNGTSMASPYTTGCCAVLVSAMKQAFPGYVPNSAQIKRALQLSATHIENMTILDEGAGLTNVPKAFELLSKWQQSGGAPGKYAIRVNVPNAVGSGTAAYYRSGLYPKHGERTEFTITPLDEKKDGTRASRLGFNAFDLVSTAKWLEPVQSSIYKRGDGALEASIRYDESMLNTPGLYAAKILGYRKGVARTTPEFELWNTVVIPNELTPENNFTCEVKNIPVHVGYLRREFFRIPPGTKAVEVSLAVGEGQSSADAILVDNDGKTFGRLHVQPKESGEEKTRWITGDELGAGVWEIVVKRGLGSDDETLSNATLSVKAFPFDVEPLELTASPEHGFEGQFMMTNQSTAVVPVGSVTATVDGYERYIDTVIAVSDSFTMPFTAGENDHAANFDVSLDRADYNLFTDISLQILRPDSSAVHNGAFDWRDASARVLFSAHDTTHYVLKFRGGLADSDKPHSFTLHIHETREFDPMDKDSKAYVATTVKRLYPGQTERFSFERTKTLPALPQGYHYNGTISCGLDDGKMEIPIEFSR
ncbi:MAG: S8 family serine peptidase [Bacteroidetes bacterium]|nr:S8 family serine peptidase [Bacteroidota bacterium]